MTLHVTIPRAELARGLKLASSVAGKSKVSPILESVLLRANGKPSLSIAATDLAVSLTAELPCEVKGSGSIAINAADLSRFVSGATGDEVSIVEADSKRADVKCGKAKYRIAGLHDRDFPKVPVASGGAVETDAKVLRDALMRAGYAVAADESRQALCGVLLEADGETAKFTSTHGHRLVKIDRKLAMPRTGRKHGVSICVAGVTAIAKMLDGADVCKVAVDGKRIHVTAGGIGISAGLLDFDAPNIEHTLSLIGKPLATATVNRDRLTAALKRVTPMTDEFHGVAFASTQAGLSVTARDADGDEISDEIECEVKGDIKIASQSKYLLDAISHMVGSSLTMRVIGEMDPIVFADHDDAGYMALVMPMRI